MTNKNQLIAGIMITVVIAGGGAFYGGIQYEKSSLTKQGLLRQEPRTGGGPNQFGAGNRQPNQGGRQFGGPGGGPNGSAGDFATGDIIGKDDKSITIKTRDGSSKIIYFSDSTTIGKSAQGSVSDLNNGEQVLVNGKSNPDGSLSAQNIQIRPAGSEVRPNQQPGQ